MTEQEQIDSANAELKKIAGATLGIWYKGACLDTAATHIPGAMRKITANKPDETTVQDAWASFSNNLDTFVSCLQMFDSPESSGIQLLDPVIG